LLKWLLIKIENTWRKPVYRKPHFIGAGLLEQ